MFHHLTFAIMVGLAVWVASVTVRIELQNAAADYYLPRRDGEPGKWRISREGTPRDELRGLVDTIGLFQYLLAPLVLVLSVVHVVRRSTPLRQRVAGICGFVGLVAWGFAIYRGYFSSLGW